jgi:hypothetical protein
METSLTEIAKKYGTDKAQNGYVEFYEKFFSRFRNESVNLLEIGIRREGPRFPFGAPSLKTWKEYFPNGNIYGLDIDPYNAKYEEERIKIFIGSQDDEKVLDVIKKEAGEFDIIIDDGSHFNKFTIASYDSLFPKLKSGGIYVIEDLGCSYIDLDTHQVRQKSAINQDWHGMHLIPENVSYKNDRTDMINFFQEKLTRMDLGVSARWRDAFKIQAPDIKSISFFSCICFIEKK